MISGSIEVMLLLVAFAAILIPLVLLVFFRMPAKYSMPISALGVALLGLTVWGMSNIVLYASVLQGMHRALTILWILAGALFFLYVLQKTGALERIKHGFFSISTDMRVQTVLVAFAFVAIIEGVSGFGTPAAVAVPLLLALGFHPLSSVVLALIGDSVPTSFGALGTPLTVGLANVADPDGGLIAAVANKVVIVDALYGLLLPIVLVSVLVLAFGRKSERRKDIFEMLPWSLCMGAVYTITALVSAWFFGVEFVSVFAGVAALAFGVVSARAGFLQPSVAWRHHALEEDREVKFEKPTMSIIKAWFPYALVIILLFIQRLSPAIKEFSMSTVDWSWVHILWVPSISSQWHVLYSPGTILLIVALITMAMFKKRLQTFTFALMQTTDKVLLTGSALVSTLIMVQIFANSGLNSQGLPSMPVYIAETFAVIFSPIWPLIAPFLGTLAAFIMGSSTVSTLTMSPVQYNVALQLGIPIDVAMAQQISGANAGNAMAVHNVVAASAVSGLHHQEGRIIRHVLPHVGLYLLCSILTASILMQIF